MSEAWSHEEQNGLSPDIDARVRSVVVKADLVPGEPTEVLNVADITSGWDQGTGYLVETPGVDLIVRERQQILRTGHRGHVGKWQEPGNPCFQLGGLLRRRYRTVFVPTADDPYTVTPYEVNALPSLDGYSHAMQKLGRHPGVDTFKLVAADTASLLARASVEAVVRLEILAARKDPDYVEHDLDPEVHLHSWWSTPGPIMWRIQHRADEVAAGGDQGLMNEFSGGLDRLQIFTRQLIKPLFELTNNKWDESGSSEEMIAQAQGIVQSLGNYNPELFYSFGDRASVNTFSSVCVPLVELGLITRLPIVKVGDDDYIETIDWLRDSSDEVDKLSPEMQRAELEVLPIVAAYAMNIADMLARSNGQESSELARALQDGLRPESILTWPKLRHVRADHNGDVDDAVLGGTPLEWDKD